MFNQGSGYSLSDIAAASGNRGEAGWTDGMGAWWIIILFLFVFMGGGWGGNWGNGANSAATQGALTRADLSQDLNFQNVENGVRGVQQGLCDGFYTNNTTLLTNFGNVQRDLCTGFSSVAQGFNTVNANLADNRYAMQSCCCDTNRNIDAVRYDNSRNTCEITQAIREEAEQTRALINANTMQELRDRLEAKNNELQSANFQLSQCAQNAYLVNELRPCPIPAYLTGSPYAAYSNGCSC
jgi:hypothetical protein